MRVRHKPWAKGWLAEQEKWVIQDPAQYKNKWHEVWESKAPIHIEIGTGKGQFITELAKRNPGVHYLGIEQYTSIIVNAVQKGVDSGSDNLKFLNIDATHLNDYFGENDVERIYLNFSDPWPKNRHEKRRLTSKQFLEQYDSILKLGGELHMKTDNQGLFEYSLESFSSFGLTLKNISLDLHRSSFKDNVMTEYEEKFVQRGMRIYRCEAVFHHR